MEFEITRNALVAQMVCDAIHNDPSGEGGNRPTSVHARAQIWYDRALELMGKSRFYYSQIADKPFEEFLCEHESNLGILDFWDGDIVDWVGRDPKENVRTGVVKDVVVGPTIDGGGKAKVLFPDGDSSWVGWKSLRHSKIPQAIVDLAKTQLLATHACPLMAHADKDKEEKNG